MKKWFIYFLSFIFIVFLLPAFLTKTKKQEEVVAIDEPASEEVVEESPVAEFQYNKYGTIKLLHAKTGEVEEVRNRRLPSKCCFSRNAGRF